MRLEPTRRTGARPTRHQAVRSIALATAVVGLLAAGCTVVNAPGGDPSFFPPTAVSEQGQETANIYAIVFWIAAAVFLLVEGILIWSVLRYRRRNDDALPKQTHGNLFAELLWTAVPAVIVLALFVLSMQSLAKVETRAASPDVTVDVYGFQWQWSFGYDCPPGFEQAFTKIDDCGLAFTGLGTEGPTMVLPVGETVRIRLHGADVNHAFYVPQFLYKKDVVPGQVNAFDVRITEAGTYPGQCAEFCGLAHAAMLFTVQAVPRAEYDAWKQQAERDAQASPSAAPSLDGSPPASPGDPGQGAVLDVSASTAQSFDQTALETTAGTPFAIHFLNNDPSAPHNVAIRGATPEGDYTGRPIADPGTAQTYQVPAIAAGEYEFYCSVHPNMKGTLSVR